MTYHADFLDAEQRVADAIPERDVNPFSGPSTMRRRVLVSQDGEPVIVLCLFVALEEGRWIVEQCFSGIMNNDKTITILYGQHVHLFDTDSHQVKSLFLDDYVGHIYSIPDVWDHKTSLSENFLVTTFQYTFLINVSSGIIWRSEPCGIDGVIIHDIREGIIYGSGEWDPPDGWAPFNLRLSDGHRA